MDIIGKEHSSCFIQKLLEATFLLLKSNSSERLSSKTCNPELMPRSQIQQEMVIVLERALRGLLFTLADSLSDNLDSGSIELFTEEGKLKDKFVEAISYRLGYDINFPEFTVPFAKIFYHEAYQGNLSTACWRIITNQKKAVYLEVVKKKRDPLFIDPLWTKAQIRKI